MIVTASLIVGALGLGPRAADGPGATPKSAAAEAEAETEAETEAESGAEADAGPESEPDGAESPDEADSFGGFSSAADTEGSGDAPEPADALESDDALGSDDALLSRSPREASEPVPGADPGPRPFWRTHNPRAAHKLSATLSVLGVSHGLALLTEYRPHWVAGLAVGVGGAARMFDSRQVRGAGTVQIEASILPVPFVVTPIVSSGFAVSFGPLVESLPGLAGNPPYRDQWVRLVPYGRFGLRVELPRRVYVEGEILVVPDNRFDQGRSTHPLPGLRVGMHVL